MYVQSHNRLQESEVTRRLTPTPSPPVPWIGRGQCVEHYGAGEAYLPVLEALGQLCRQPGGEQVVALLSRYAPTWLVQMPALMSDTELEAVQRKVQGATRERMLREMAEALEALTAERSAGAGDGRCALERLFHAGPARHCWPSAVGRLVYSCSGRIGPQTSS